MTAAKHVRCVKCLQIMFLICANCARCNGDDIIKESVFNIIEKLHNVITTSQESRDTLISLGKPS